MPRRRSTTPTAPIHGASSMLCFECQKLWFGAASQAGVARECPDCGSRLVPNVPTRPSEVHGARVQ